MQYALERDHWGCGSLSVFEQHGHGPHFRPIERASPHTPQHTHALTRGRSRGELQASATSSGLQPLPLGSPARSASLRGSPARVSGDGSPRPIRTGVGGIRGRASFSSFHASSPSATGGGGSGGAGGGGGEGGTPQATVAAGARAQAFAHLTLRRAAPQTWAALFKKAAPPSNLGSVSELSVYNEDSDAAPRSDTPPVDIVHLQIAQLRTSRRRTDEDVATGVAAQSSETSARMRLHLSHSAEPLERAASATADGAQAHPATAAAAPPPSAAVAAAAAPAAAGADSGTASAAGPSEAQSPSSIVRSHEITTLQSDYRMLFPSPRSPEAPTPQQPAQQPEQQAAAVPTSPAAAVAGTPPAARAEPEQAVTPPALHGDSDSLADSVSDSNATTSKDCAPAAKGWQRCGTELFSGARGAATAAGVGKRSAGQQMFNSSKRAESQRSEASAKQAAAPFAAPNRQRSPAPAAQAAAQLAVPPLKLPAADDAALSSTRLTTSPNAQLPSIAAAPGSRTGSAPHTQPAMASAALQPEAHDASDTAASAQARSPKRDNLSITAGPPPAPAVPPARAAQTAAAPVPVPAASPPVATPRRAAESAVATGAFGSITEAAPIASAHFARPSRDSIATEAATSVVTDAATSQTSTVLPQADSISFNALQRLPAASAPHFREPTRESHVPARRQHWFHAASHSGSAASPRSGGGGGAFGAFGAAGGSSSTSNSLFPQSPRSNQPGLENAALAQLERMRERSLQADKPTPASSTAGSTARAAPSAASGTNAGRAPNAFAQQQQSTAARAQASAGPIAQQGQAQQHPTGGVFAAQQPPAGGLFAAPRSPERPQANAAAVAARGGRASATRGSASRSPAPPQGQQRQRQPQPGLQQTQQGRRPQHHLQQQAPAQKQKQTQARRRESHSRHNSRTPRGSPGAGSSPRDYDSDVGPASSSQRSPATSSAQRSPQTAAAQPAADATHSANGAAAPQQPSAAEHRSAAKPALRVPAQSPWAAGPPPAVLQHKSPRGGKPGAPVATGAAGAATGVPAQREKAAWQRADMKLEQLHDSSEKRRTRAAARLKLLAAADLPFQRVAQLRPDLALSVDEEFEAAELLFEAAEASVSYALTSFSRRGDAARGNITLASFMLHHCVHSSLEKYSNLNPFLCASTSACRPFRRADDFSWRRELQLHTCSVLYTALRCSTNALQVTLSCRTAVQASMHLLCCRHGSSHQWTKLVDLRPYPLSLAASATADAHPKYRTDFLQQWSPFISSESDLRAQLRHKSLFAQMNPYVASPEEAGDDDVPQRSHDCLLSRLSHLAQRVVQISNGAVTAEVEARCMRLLKLLRRFVARAEDIESEGNAAGQVTEPPQLDPLSVLHYSECEGEGADLVRTFACI